MAVLSNTGIRAGASAAGDSGYKIEKSLRFNPGDTAYLSHTPSSSSPAFAQKQFTISFWTKVDGSTSNSFAWCTAGATSQVNYLLQFYIEYGKIVINSSSMYMMSARRLTDPSAWYHICLAVDTTLSTEADRIKVWVNNERITEWSSNTAPSQDYPFIWNTNVVHRIGGMNNSSGALGSYLHGYLAEFHSIDGQTLDTSYFGETNDNGKWIPKEYTGTYGPLVNQSQTWSDSVTNPSGAYGVAANAFDGDETTHASPNYSNPMTYTNASPSDTVIQTFEVKCDIYTMSGITDELNDTDITSQLTTTDQWHTITGFTDEQVEKFYWRPSSENYEVRIKAIRINGKILVDDDVTITNNGFYFKFTGSNLGEDSSGKGNNWTANNLTAASTIFDVPCVPFDGTDDYLELDDSTDFDFGTNDFTMECFVNPDSPGSDAYQSLVMKADAGTSYAGSSWWWALYSYAAGTSLSYCYIYDGSTYKVLQGSSLPNGKWHHIAVVRDGDTARLYHNGVQVDSTSVSGWTMNTCSNAVRIGTDGGGNYDMNGGISNVRIVNGTCLYPNGTTFTVPSRPLENVTNTKLLCCQSSSTTADDNSDSDHTITSSDDAAATTLSDDSDEDDATSDSPTDYDDGGNGVGTYPTWNPLYHMRAGSGHYELAQGNLRAYDATNTYGFLDTTMYVKSGKWYAEMWITGGTLSADYDIVGIVADQERPSDIGGSVVGYWYSPGGEKIDKSTGWDGTAYGASWALGDIIGIAMDLDAGVVTFYKNGVSQGAAFTGIDLTRSYSFATSDYSNAQTSTYRWINCGQRPFKHTPPTGFKALNTYNLPDPVIKDPKKYFDISLYGGNETSYTISGLSFSPDLVWSKRKDAAARHALCDTVRGATKDISCDRDDPEITTSDGLTQFNSDGYEIGADVGEYGWNASATSYFVNWAWDAASSNTEVSASGLDSSIYTSTSDGSGDISPTPTSNPLKGFDGDPTTLFYDTSISAGTYLTWTPSSAIAYSTGVDIMFAAGVDGTSYKINGGGAVGPFTTTDNWVNVLSGSGSLTSIGITRNATDVHGWRAIRVDGKILHDSGVTPPTLPSIASTYRANTNAGFSIVTYTGNNTAGDTVAHGLGARPDFIVVKNLDTDGEDWIVYHSYHGAGKYQKLNKDEGPTTSSDGWGGKEPTNHVFSLGAWGDVNASGQDFVAYCWSEVEGYSKFGNYEADASTATDNAWLNCGFKPAWVMIKRADGDGHWTIFDSARTPINDGTPDYLRASGTDQEATDYDCEFLSNGFKIRDSDSNVGSSGTRSVSYTHLTLPTIYSV